MMKITKSLKAFAIKHIREIIFVGVMTVLLVILAILKNNSYIAEYVFARSISRFLLFILSRVSNLFSFSLTELTYVLGFVAIIAAIVFLIRHLVKKEYKKFGRGIYKIGCLALSLIVAINLIFTVSYNRYPMIDELNLFESEINLQTTFDATKFYVQKASSLATKFEREKSGASISPYTFEELVAKINAEYSRLDSDYFSKFDVRNKKVFLSEGMSYLGITGIFFPFYGESSINVCVPSYSLPVTIAHELAHSKGVMRENEANFLAYYLLITSEDEYFNYCGLMSASARMLSECYDENDRSYYDSAYELFSDEMFMEYSASNEFWRQYEGFMESIATFFNNFYLKSSGVSSGVKSYSETGVHLIRLYQTLKNQVD